MRFALVSSLLALVVLVGVVWFAYDSISTGLTYATLAVLESADMVDYGPEQELTSPWTAEPPVLDGHLAAGEWVYAASVAIDASDKLRPGVASRDSNTVMSGADPGAIPHESNHATLYVMNDERYVYVAIDVSDDILDFDMSGQRIWQCDSVEIRMDGDNSRNPWREETRLGNTTIVLGDGNLVKPEYDYVPIVAALKPDGSGYIVEARWDAEGFAESIGFDVAINDSDDPEIDRRHAQYFWNGTRDNGWRDEREWGTVHLAKDPNAPTPQADAVAASKSSPQ